MRMTWLGVASLLSVSFSVGCSTGAPTSAQAALDTRLVGQVELSSSLANLASAEPRYLPPGVVQPGPVYHEGDDHPMSPSGPACMLCPTSFGATLDAGTWALAGRPDPVEIAEALGAPELASAISDRIVDTEAALAEVPASDHARANALAATLAHDLDALARSL
jgi:hypothetical protein